MHEEIFATRDRSYGAWHRRLSLGRFVGVEVAADFSMIDVDAVLYVEYDKRTTEPIALIEAARDVGQDYKCATVTARLAKRARLPAYILLYTNAAVPNVADPRYADIERFRVKRLHPRAEREWRELEPLEWAHAIVQIRAWAVRRSGLIAANDSSWSEEFEIE
jgi:hypothetical protein